MPGHEEGLYFFNSVAVPDQYCTSWVLNPLFTSCTLALNVIIDNTERYQHACMLIEFDVEFGVAHCCLTIKYLREMEQPLAASKMMNDDDDLRLL